MEAVAIQGPEQCEEGCKARHAEPGGLEIRRGDGEIERVASFVPHAAVIRGDDAKAVAPRRQIAIEGLPAIAHVLPVAIVAFQFVFEMVLLWRDQAESGIVDLEIASQCGQAPVRRAIVLFTTGSDLLNVHRRWKRVQRKMLRIDDADPVLGCEPYFPIERFGHLSAVTAGNSTGPHSIGAVESRRSDGALRITHPVL